ncbi:MAG: T9SS type A sorting domain-containing protein [Bacteroidota bacterium]
MKHHHMHKQLLFTVFFLFLFAAFSHAQCTIENISIEESVCDEQDRFSVEINFSHSGTGANGFQILGNGNNYGTFQYENLPVTIDGLAGNCEIDFEFIIRDVDDPTCATFGELGPVCCDEVCELAIVDFETSECENNNNYSISFDLESNFEGENGISVSVNGEDLGTFEYEELPLTIDNIISVEQGLNTFTVCDNDFADCCNTYSFLNPCICGMTDITTEIVDCSVDDSTYFVIINFDHVATNDSFQMAYTNEGENTFLGVFAYSDLPVTAGPISLSDDDVDILVADTENFFCFSLAYTGIVNDCEIQCQLFNLFGEAYMCEEGEYFIDLEFEGEDLEGGTFDVLVDDVHYGTFEYGLNMYTVGPIPSNCDTPPVLIVEDNFTEGCSDFFNFSEPICCLPECNFISLEATSECGQESIQVFGEFENNGSMLGAFYFVQIAGTSYGPFPYGDFTFEIEIPLLADGEYAISINDASDPECLISGSFLVQCEPDPCLIFDVFAEAQECEENIFFVDVEFDFIGEVSDSVTITGNGVTYGTFAYGEEFYTVGPLEGDCETIYEFLVSDQIMEGCNSFFALEEPVCCLPDCRISDIEVIDFECIDSSSISSITIGFNFENVTSDQFTLALNGFIQEGSWFYSDLPVELEIFLPATIFTLSIEDFENTDCSASQFIELDCSEEECPIENESFDIVDCSEELGTYFLEVTVEHGENADSLEFFINDNLVFIESYDQLPIIVGPFDLGTEYVIAINDTEAEEDCVIETLVLNDICETSTKEDFFQNVNVYQSMNSLITENNEAEAFHFQLLSLTGETISKWSLEANRTKLIDSTSFPSGIYLLNIAGQRNHKTMKIAIF